MRSELHPAYVLHRRAFKETSALVDLFSSKYGRIGAVAKGVRRKKSGLSGILQTFQLLQVAWSGRGELVTITSAEPADTPIIYSGRSLLNGFYLNELLMRFLHRNDPHPELFSMYHASLRALTDNDKEESVLRLFEKVLLKSIGYGLVLDHDVVTDDKIDPDRKYVYRMNKGPSEHFTQAANEVVIHGATLHALGAERLVDDNTLREAKLLMRSVISHYLGDRPLMSRELFNNYKKVVT